MIFFIKNIVDRCMSNDFLFSDDMPPPSYDSLFFSKNLEEK